MKIDIHCHFYPEPYLEEIGRLGPEIGVLVEKDEWGRTVLVQNGNRFVTLTAPMTDVDLRLEDMARAGIDRQVLTLTAPSVDNLPQEAAGRLARVANEAFGQICREHPDSFYALATLPFLDPEAAVRELDHCLDRLSFRGACLGSNVNGRPLDDPVFYPFYERMSALRLPIHLHPRTPFKTELFRDYRLAPMLGFEIDLSVAVVRLVMGGVLEKFPGLRFVVSHLGGAVPFLAERIQNCYQAYPECRANITRPALDYLKEFYWDTVSFHPPALRCAYDTFGPERLVLGSDYPHVIGDIKRAVTSIEELPISSAEKEMIFSGNLTKLMEGGS
ncbi:MAG: amidohydrolase family protein [Thermodesulfobacteriota bacterium]